MLGIVRVRMTSSGFEVRGRLALRRPTTAPGGRQPSVDVPSTFSIAKGFLGGVGSDDAGISDDWGEEDVEVPCEEGCAYEKREDWGR